MVMGYYAVLKSSQLEAKQERPAAATNSRLFLYPKPFTFGQGLPEESLLARLCGSLLDALFPQKFPPLRLTSRPVAVADPLSEKRSRATSVASFAIHGAVIAAMLWVALQPRPHVVAAKQQQIITPITFHPFIPPTPPAPKPMAGGGGGGLHEVVEASKGRIPPVEKLRVTPPQILRIAHPMLATPPAVEAPRQINIPNNTMPNLGVPQSPMIAMASQGSGGGSGFGQGLGGGIGAGQGGGVGQGMGGGYGGGVMSVGGGVSAPQLLHSVEPEFTDAARQARYQGVVSIQLIVDTSGNPENIQVVRHLGMGLDEKAIDAVRQYRFRPAMYGGHPVAVRLMVDVDFRLF